MESLRNPHSECAIAQVLYNHVGRHKYKVVSKLGGDGKKYLSARDLADYIRHNPHNLEFNFEEGVKDDIIAELKSRGLELLV